MRRRDFLGTPLALFAVPATAQEGYPPVMPDRTFGFPRDHGSHPEFRVEWWYVTGWVMDEGGREYGFQVTFFRNRPRVAEDNPSAFAPRQLIFAHAALAVPRENRLRHDQRAAREGFGLVSASEATTRVAIDDWALVLDGDAYRARIVARSFSFDFTLAATQPVLLNGDAGFSRKGPLASQASYYYSRPQLRVTGTLAIDDKAAAVTGRAWLDHEWSSEMMAPAAIGWDWIGVNFADGNALMAFRMRDGAGAALWAGGTFRRDGVVRAFAPGEVRFAPRRIWKSPRTGVEYPVAMTVTAGDIVCTLEPLFDDQELDARASTGTIYWEGAVRASVRDGEAGHGYLELTGYGTPLRL